MLDVLQIIGALLVLAAFVALQVKRMRPTSYTYLTLNAGGSALLALLAVIGHQWGFLLLEGTWAAVSVVALGGQLRRRGTGYSNRPLRSKPGSDSAR
jgi:uncharacterized membrane protein YhaH (DUF805 family)